MSTPLNCRGPRRAAARRPEPGSSNQRKSPRAHAGRARTGADTAPPEHRCPAPALPPEEGQHRPDLARPPSEGCQGPDIRSAGSCLPAHQPEPHCCADRLPSRRACLLRPPSLLAPSPLRCHRERRCRAPPLPTGLVNKVLTSGWSHLLGRDQAGYKGCRQPPVLHHPTPGWATSRFAALW